MSPNGSRPTWHPTAALENIKLRSAITWRIRSFFHQRGFCEIHPPTLSRDTVVDRYIEPIRVPAASLQLAASLPGTPSEACYYLQTSPEFALKRLLSAGMDAIYSLGPAYRAGEFGTFHNPEFTMLEWYRVGDDLDSGVELLSELVHTALQTASCDPENRTEVLAYRDAFARYLQLDPIDCPLSRLVQAAIENNLAVDATWSDDRDEWLNLLFAELIQPHLGTTDPTILINYPSSQSALARISPQDPQTAERFELFWRGVELANGYNELLDATELSSRNAVTNQQRVADGHRRLPTHSHLLDAMQHGLPACSGCALGLDRLVLLACNARSIQDVVAFPIDRA